MMFQGDQIIYIYISETFKIPVYRSFHGQKVCRTDKTKKIKQERKEEKDLRKAEYMDEINKSEYDRCISYHCSLDKVCCIC